MYDEDGGSGCVHRGRVRAVVPGRVPRGCARPEANNVYARKISRAVVGGYCDAGRAARIARYTRRAAAGLPLFDGCEGGGT